MSSRKGSAFERLIAVQLSEWWTTGLGKPTRQDVFWRSSSSGARATIRQKSGRKTSGQYGDLCAIDPIGAPLIDVLTIELKNGYSSDTIANLLDYQKQAKIQQYEEWFIKLHKSHQDAGSLGWALIHKRTRREPMIFLPNGLFGSILDGNRLPPTLLTICPPLRGPQKIHQLSIVGMRFSAFLDCVAPESIVKLSRM